MFTKSLGKNQRQRRRLVAVLLAGAMALAACGDDDDTATVGDDPEVTQPTASTASDETESEAPSASSGEGIDLEPLASSTAVTVGMPVDLELFAPVILADSFGEYEDANLDVEFVSAPQSDLITMLGTGQVDVVLGSFQPAVYNAIHSGLEVRAVAPLMHSPGENKEGLWVPADMAEGLPESLDGATIASITGLGSNIMIPIGKYLEDNGMSITDVELERIAGADTITALEQGVVDAAWLGAPYFLEAEERGLGEWVFGYEPGMQGTAIFFGERLLNDEREVGEQFVAATARTVRDHLQGDYKSDPEVVEALTTALGVDEETLTRTAPLEFHPNMYMPTEAPELQQRYTLEYPDLLLYSEPLPEDQLFDLGLLEGLGLGAEE